VIAAKSANHDPHLNIDVQTVWQCGNRKRWSQQVKLRRHALESTSQAGTIGAN
jgi:hypothetical protein